MASRVLSFWFGAANPCLKPNYGLWFGKSDNKNVDQFLELHQKATKARVFGSDPLDTLAEIIVLDQFSRDLFDDERMFKWDSEARKLSRELMPLYGSLDSFGMYEWMFAFMPLMHSEDISDQKDSLKYFGKLKEKYPEQAQGTYNYAVEHHDIIARFNRFPHRNAVLKRQSTIEEIEFLKEHKGF